MMAHFFETPEVESVSQITQQITRDGLNQSHLQRLLWTGGCSCGGAVCVLSLAALRRCASAVAVDTDKRQEAGNLQWWWGGGTVFGFGPVAWAHPGHVRRQALKAPPN
jgi:hypothetical protein